MSQQTRQPSVLQEHTLIDADVHLFFDTEDLIPYIDSPHDKRIKNAGPIGRVPRDGWDRVMGGKIQASIYDTESAEAVQKNVCEDFYVDYPVLNTFGLMSRNPEVEYSHALARAHNDLLLDQFLDAYDHFYGLATITTQDPHAAAEELDRMGNESDIVGAYVHNTGPNPPLGDPFYDPMWRAAEDNGLNIAFHGSANGFMFEFSRQNQALNQFLPVHLLAHPWSQMLTMVSLLTEGTVEKFPDLKFAFLEAGLLWAPYVLFRMNKEYSIRRSEAPLLEQSPEEYAKEKMYFGSQPIEEPNENETMEHVFEIVGTDSMLFCTDYPHWDFDTPDALDRHLRSSFSEEERTAVMSGNAAELFGLSV